MVILLAGKMGAGKSAIKAALLKRLYGQATGVKFADVLYTMHDACREIARNYGMAFPDKNRRFLELVGTEVFRAADPDCWVKVTRTYVDTLLDDCGVEYVVIDDVRHLNEIDAFGKRGLKVWLECDEQVRKRRASAWVDDQNHKSNTGLDSYRQFDLVLPTDYVSVDDCVEAILRFL